MRLIVAYVQRYVRTITKIQSCQPTKWYQGWTNDEQDRLKASSGGFATAIAKSFIKNKGIVYSCVFKNGEFIFESDKK